MKTVFFYHYSKPASRAAKSPKLSLHYRGACHIIDSISCYVPTYSRNRKIQPHVVITGKSDNIIIKDGAALIQ